MKIVEQTIDFDEKGVYLYTKYEDGSISCEPITSEEAMEIRASQGRFV